jgi:hypothetical protein
MQEPTVIFLDIDGVLTTASTGWKSFHPDCVKALKHLLDNTNAVMVLSSCWRHGFIDWTDEDHKLIDQKDAPAKLREWMDNCGLQGSRLIDVTPTPFNAIRGKEIDLWLQQHSRVKKFVILDDDNDMEPYINQLVETDPSKGLTLENAEQAIKLLTFPPASKI